MAPCSTWKGSLQFSSVACTVSMTPATSGNEGLHSYPLDRVARHALDASALASADTIDIEAFVPKEAIEWTWYDKAHYMMPEDLSGEFAFSAIRDAMEETGTVAIANLLLYGRERTVMLEPRDMGIVLWTLRHRSDALALQDRIVIDLPDLDMATMNRVSAEIDKRWKPWHPQLRDLPFVAGRKPAKDVARSEWNGNIVDISDARRRQASQYADEGRGDALRRFPETPAGLSAKKYVKQ